MPLILKLIDRGVQTNVIEGTSVRRLRWWLLPIVVVAGFGSGWWCNQYSKPTTTRQLEHVKLLVQDDRDEAASSLLRQLIHLEPDRTRPRIQLAELSLKKKDWPVVAAALQGVPDSSLSAYWARTNEGDAWFGLGYLARAEASWLKAEHIQSSAAVLERLVYLYGLQRRRDDELQSLWNLYDRGELNFTSLIRLMSPHYSVHSKSDSFDLIMRSVRQEPANLNSKRASIILTAHQRDTESSREELRQLFNDNRQDHGTWLLLVKHSILSSGTTEVGQNEIGHLMDNAPEASAMKSDFWTLRAEFAMLKGDYETAVGCLQRAVRGSYFDITVRHRLAQAMRLSGTPDLAHEHELFAQSLLEIDRKILELDGRQGNGPNEVIIHPIMALCESIGMIEEATAWASLGLKRRPDDVIVQNTLSRLLKQKQTSSRRPPSSSKPFKSEQP